MYLNLQSGGIQKGSTWNKVQMAAHSMNRKAMRDAQTAKGKDGQEQRRDKVQITPENQMQGRLDFLMERKQELIERKNELMASGADWDSIKAMVALYEEQISNVETEISQTLKEMVEEQLEKAEEEKKDGKDPETKEEQQIQHLNNISNASLDYKQVGQIHKAHDQKEREASVMTMEVKLDDSRGGASKGKRERLGEVLSEADQLYKKAMKGYAHLNKSLDEEEEENIEEQRELKSEDGQGNGAVSGPAGGEQDNASGPASGEQDTVSGSAEGAQDAASKPAGRDTEEDE